MHVCYITHYSHTEYAKISEPNDDTEFHFKTLFSYVEKKITVNININYEQKMKSASDAMTYFDKYLFHVTTLKCFLCIYFFNCE